MKMGVILGSVLRLRGERNQLTQTPVEPAYEYDWNAVKHDE
jgi:hypothetical protein